MSTDYVPSPALFTIATVPDDGDTADAASVGVPFEQLADGLAGRVPAYAIGGDTDFDERVDGGIAFTREAYAGVRCRVESPNPLASHDLDGGADVYLCGSVGAAGAARVWSLPIVTAAILGRRVRFVRLYDDDEEGNARDLIVRGRLPGGFNYAICTMGTPTGGVARNGNWLEVVAVTVTGSSDMRWVPVAFGGAALVFEASAWLRGDA